MCLATVLSFLDCVFSVVCNKTFNKVYTLLSHTHLTTLSHLLAVGGVTFLASWTGYRIKRDYTRAVYPLIDLWEGSHFLSVLIFTDVCVSV